MSNHHFTGETQQSKERGAHDHTVVAGTIAHVMRLRRRQEGIFPLL
jgi:hypothetical protein